MTFPSNLRYTKDHEWISLEGNVATIGITEFAQGELGDIVYVDISTKGKSLAAEEVFGTVEAVKTVSDSFFTGKRHHYRSKSCTGSTTRTGEYRSVWPGLDDKNDR
ncbi:MAG: hypothetical protein QM738_08645 [Ferruginibacter sp.]